MSDNRYNVPPGGIDGRPPSKYLVLIWETTALVALMGDHPVKLNQYMSKWLQFELKRKGEPDLPQGGFIHMSGGPYLTRAHYRQTIWRILNDHAFCLIHSINLDTGTRNIAWWITISNDGVKFYINRFFIIYINCSYVDYDRAEAIRDSMPARSLQSLSLDRRPHSEAPGGPPSAQGHLDIRGSLYPPPSSAPPTMLSAPSTMLRSSSLDRVLEHPGPIPDSPGSPTSLVTYTNPILNPQYPDSPPPALPPDRPLPPAPVPEQPVQPGLFRSLGGTDIYNNPASLTTGADSDIMSRDSGYNMSQGSINPEYENRESLHNNYNSRPLSITSVASSLYNEGLTPKFENADEFMIWI